MLKGGPFVRPATPSLPRYGAGRALTAAALLAFVPGVSAAESLFDAIQMAAQTNPQLRAQQAQLRATGEGVAQARSGYGPQVSANAQVNYDSGRVGQSTGPSTSTTNSVGSRGTTGSATLSAVQPIFTSGAVRAQVATASANVAAARQNVRQVEAQVLLGVITAYEDVRRDRQTLAILREQITAIEAEYRDTQARGRLGVLTRTDVAQSQARLVAAQSQLALAQGRLSASTAAYRNVVGQPPGELAPEPQLPGLPGTAEEAFDAAEHENPQLLAAVETERAAAAEVKRAKAAYGPNVSVQATAGATPNTFSTGSQYNTGVAVGAVLSQPLFTSGLTQSRVREALENNNRARLDIETVRRGVVQQIAHSWEQVSSTRAAAELQQQQVELQAVASRGNRVEEKAGLRTTIDLLNAELELSNTRIALLQSRHDAYVAQAVLLGSIGRLEARYLLAGAAAAAPAKPAPPPEAIATGNVAIAQAEISPPALPPPPRPTPSPEPSRAAPSQDRAPPGLRPAETPSRPPATTGASRAQIGAFSSDELARRALRDLARAMPQAVAGASTQVEQANVAGKTYYRSYVGGFPGARDAEAFCGKLRAAGRACIAR